MLDHVFVEGVDNTTAFNSLQKAMWNRRYSQTKAEQDMLMKGTQQAVEKNLHHRGVCDRCERAWLVTFSDDGKRAEIAESEYAQTGLPRHPEQRLIDLDPAYIPYLASKGVTGSVALKLFWMSPTACPGNNDGSCLALAPASYWERPVSRWNMRHTFGDGLLRDDKNDTYNFREWIEMGLPSEMILPAKDGRDALLKKYPTPVLDITTGPHHVTDGWRNYLAWRLIWIRYWVRGGSRNARRRMSRMWGHVEADAQLHDMGVLSDADFEDIYCMPLKLVDAIWKHKCFEAIDRLEQFAGVRRDLNKATFGRVQSTILKAKAAVQNWTRYATSKAEDVMYTKLNDINYTMMHMLNLPIEKAWPGRLPHIVPEAPAPTPSIPLMSLDDSNLNAWFIEHVINHKLAEFAQFSNYACGCPRGGMLQRPECERVYRAQKRAEANVDAPPVPVSGTEIPLPPMPFPPAMPATTVPGDWSPESGSYVETPRMEVSMPSEGVISWSAEGKIIAYDSRATVSPAVAVADAVRSMTDELAMAIENQGAQGQIRWNYWGGDVGYTASAPDNCYQSWVSEGQVYWY
ncbi:hypothetical protein ACHAQA_001285 [Verticillium albo-atrum]